MRTLLLLLIVVCLAGCQNAPKAHSSSTVTTDQTRVDDTETIQTLFQSALHHLRNDDTPAALTDLRKAAASQPDNPEVVEAFLVVAMKMRKTGQIEQGLQVLDLALELQPEKAHFWQTKGSFLFAAQKPVEARQALVKARELAPEDPAIVYDMGWQAAQAEATYQQALLDYSAAIELDEAYKKAWTNRGALQSRMGRHAEGLKDLERAIELDPDDSVALYEMASVQLAAGKTDEAKKFAQKVVSLNNHPQAVQAAQLLLDKVE